MMLYFLYQYSNRLEKDDFVGKPADMSYMLLVIYAVTSKYNSNSKFEFQILEFIACDSWSMNHSYDTKPILVRISDSEPSDSNVFDISIRKELNKAT